MRDPSHTHPGERNKHGVGFMAPVPYALLCRILFKTRKTSSNREVLVPRALSKAGRLGSVG